MTTSYKVLGQGLNELTYSTNSTTSTIISKLKIKNISYPGRVSVSLVENPVNTENIPLKSYLIKNKEIMFGEPLEIDGGIVVDPDHSLIVELDSGESVIVQAYGIEETV